MPPRRSTGLRRSVGFRPTRKTLWVFCEGENSEQQYLAALKAEPGIADSVAMTVDREPGQPLKLVERAVEARARAMAEGGEIDEFWCLFDVEWPQNHPHLEEAVALARKHGILLAISNPCFELWLLLHHSDLSAWLTTKAAGAAVKQNRTQAHPKDVDGSAYMPHRRVAFTRARKLDRVHQQNGNCFPDDNPSSGMHRFLSSVEPEMAEIKYVKRPTKRQKPKR